MKLFFSVLICLMFIFTASAQLDYKYDNVVYKTMDPSDLSRFLKEHPNTLLIDVRTPGEHQDTSKYGSLNIGRLKGAINIEIDSLPTRIESLRYQADKPIILYCSHSQRSRRGSKLLMENGFKEVYNLNGGMTWINQTNETEFPDKKQMIIYGVPFINLPVEESFELIDKSKELIIIDVRPELEFAGKDTMQENNLGRLKNAINIPHQSLKDRLGEIEKYKNTDIIVYDQNGALSFHAAKLLNENGFRKVYNMVGGLQAILGKEKSTIEMRKIVLSNTPAYTLLNAREGFDLLQGKKDLVIFDVRSNEEYNNKSDKVWLNLGRLKNSENIDGKDFDLSKTDLLSSKDKTILVYGTASKAAKVSKMLVDAGFKDVNMLYGSLWGLVSASANHRGFGDIKPYMESYEGLY